MSNSTGSWTFDESVAKRFDAEARAHIPNYESVVQKCVDIAVDAFPNKDACKIIDVGSATGYTLESLRKAGFTDVWGVDSSPSMLAHSRVRENLICSNNFPRAEGPYDVVLANWTLHFIEARGKYLRDIRDSLKMNGILIISEKMDSSRLVEDHYHDFKRSMGVSEEEIQRKAAAIRGVLVTRPLQWYFDTLEGLGFKVEIIDASWCFKTLLCTL